MSTNEFKRVLWTVECLCKYDRPRHAYKRQVTRIARARMRERTFREWRDVA